MAWSLVWQTGRLSMFAVALLSVLAGVLPAASAYVTKLLVDTIARSVLAQSPHAASQAVSISMPWHQVVPVPWPPAVIVVVLALAQVVAVLATSMVVAGRAVVLQLLQQRVSLAVQLQILAHAADLDLAFFEDSASYDLLRRTLSDGPSRPVSMVAGTIGLLQSGLTFVSVVTMAVVAGPLLIALVVLAPVPGLIVDLRSSRRGVIVAEQLTPLRRRVTYLTQLLTADTHAKEIRALGTGPYFLGLCRDLLREDYAAARGLAVRRFILQEPMRGLSACAIASVYVAVAFEVMAGRLTLGDLSLYATAASLMQTSVQSMLMDAGRVFEHGLFLRQLRTLLDVRPRITATQAPAEPAMASPKPARVELERVTFRYPGAEVPALRDFSLVIQPGTIVAVVGANGAGKSTLVKLLLRLYDPEAGRILVDGRDIRELDPAEYRAGIGPLFQDFGRYQATFAENIAIGDIGRSPDRLRVERAAMEAGASAIANRLPSGLDTQLGRWFENGVELSGGEWQRVAVARTFLRQARLLLLDEPSASLDARSEHDLFETLRALRRARTTLYVSHRLVNLRDADAIAVVDRGRLLEIGSHDELMASRGQYAQMYGLQAAMYAETRPSCSTLSATPVRL